MPNCVDLHVQVPGLRKYSPAPFLLLGGGRGHRWARYFKKVAERALNAKKKILSASALQGLKSDSGAKKKI